MDIAFPEKIRSIPRSRRPLALSHVLALVYCFGGLTGLTYILSKFVVTPLFEQLTFDRRLLAEEVRERLVQFNLVLGHTASRIPAVTSSNNDYVEQTVQADHKPETKPDEKTEYEAKDSPFDGVNLGKDAHVVVSQLRELREGYKSIDLNNEWLTSQASIADQAGELAKYLRQLQYSVIPSSFLALTGSSETGAKEDNVLRAAYSDFKMEVRSMKSLLLLG